MSSIVNPLPAGSFTLRGKTQGPAVALGPCRYRKSQVMFMDESELRDANAAMGFPNPQTHQKVVDELAAANEQLASLDAQVKSQAHEIATLEEALGWRKKRGLHKAKS